MQENFLNMETNNPIPEGKNKFETKMYTDGQGVLKQGVFINNELLDWSIGPQYMEMLKTDIVRHFTQSCSEFLGRKVTAKEIDDARKNGYI